MCSLVDMPWQLTVVTSDIELDYHCGITDRTELVGSTYIGKYIGIPQPTLSTH